MTVTHKPNRPVCTACNPWQVAQDVYDNPQRHTLLPLPHPVIVPGGRFRENYYWDSYWIVLGLLACGQVDTATGVRCQFTAHSVISHASQCAVVVSHRHRSCNDNYMYLCA